MGFNKAYHKQRKLSEQQVLNIRLLATREWFSLSELARVFKVSRKTITDIVNRRKYKDIP